MKSKGMRKGMQIDIARAEAVFKSATLPFMFEEVSAVDAFYAILAFRLKAYGINFDGEAGEYQERLLNWSLLQGALEQAPEWVTTSLNS